MGAAAFALSFLNLGAAVWWLRIGGIVFILLGVSLLLTKEKKAEPVNEQYRYAVKESFMSEPERRLYARLLRAAGSDFEVFPQVALASLIDKVNFGSYRNELFRIVDFALCDRRTLKPRLIVELNDASHNRADRIARDEKVRCIAERAGLNVLTLTLEDDFDERVLRKRFMPRFDRINLRIPVLPTYFAFS